MSADVYHVDDVWCRAARNGAAGLALLKGIPLGGSGGRGKATPAEALPPRLISPGTGISAGRGWIEFDPTNALAGGRNLTRVAVTRDPTQAIPMGGSFTGASNPFRGMNVEVEIKAEESAG